MKQWMRAANAAQQEQLAKAVGTSRAYLYHLAGDESANYAREPKPKLAAAIERVTEQMHAADPKLPRVYRTDLVTACRECAFARECLGPIVDRVEFDVVEGAKQ